MSIPIVPGATPEAPVEPVIEPAEPANPTEGEAELREAGKQALDRMKAERTAAKAEAKAAIARAEAAEAALANKDKPAEEIALADAEKRGADAATKAANLRIVKSEIKAAAALKLTKPEDALAFIDPNDFDVDDNGDVDTDALNAAITQLLTERPYLAAANAPRFDGAGDGGAGAPPKPKESFDEAIAAAVAVRNFSLAATLRTQKAAEQAKKG